MITNKLELTKKCDSAIMNIIVVWARLNFLDTAIVLIVLVISAVSVELCWLCIFLMRAECLAENV